MVKNPGKCRILKCDGLAYANTLFSLFKYLEYGHSTGQKIESDITNIIVLKGMVSRKTMSW